MSNGHAGSIHDAGTLRMSSLYTAIENHGVVHSPFVADPAYKRTTWCMKRFPQTGVQRGFNKSLSSAKVLVELAFSLLKGR